jgi:hypothetical protein
MVSASYDETVRLWGTATGANPQTFKNCLIQQLIFSREGSYLETDRGLISTPDGGIPMTWTVDGIVWQINTMYTILLGLTLKTLCLSFILERLLAY